MQSKDSFFSGYMGWLGHYEFGSTHKPFHSGSRLALPESEYDRRDVNYWLTIWINAYRYLLESAPKGSIFLASKRFVDRRKKNCFAFFPKPAFIRKKMCGKE